MARRPPLRITAGELKGRAFDAPEGEGTRPGLTRVRQALFDSLATRLGGASVLDMFGGSGAFSFEALSRGATSVVAIDLDRRACRVMGRNAGSLAVEDRCRIVQADSLLYGAQLATNAERFDLVFVAPPYWKGLQREALVVVEAHKLLALDGVAVVQRDGREQPAETDLGGLRMLRERRWGNTVVAFYSWRR